MKREQKKALRIMPIQELEKIRQDLDMQLIKLEAKFRPGMKRIGFAKETNPKFKLLRRTIAVIETIIKEKKVKK